MYGDIGSKDLTKANPKFSKENSCTLSQTSGTCDGVIWAPSSLCLPTFPTLLPLPLIDSILSQLHSVLASFFSKCSIYCMYLEHPGISVYFIFTASYTSLQGSLFPGSQTLPHVTWTQQLSRTMDPSILHRFFFQILCPVTSRVKFSSLGCSLLLLYCPSKTLFAFQADLGKMLL